MATLFVKTERGRPVRLLQVCVPGRGRKTLRLGQLPARAAERYRDKIESLVAFRRLGQPFDPEMAKWLAGVPDPAYADLVEIGLAEPRDGPSLMPTLKAFYDKYLAQKCGGVAPRSITLLEQTRDRMLGFFGAGTPLDQITPDRTADWRAAMLEEKLSEATVRLHTRNAKSVFNSAVDRELIARNPFRSLPTTAVAAARDRYVSPDEARRVLAALPGHKHRLLFGLARYAGLRVPSETHILTWAGIDLREGRMTVYAPKTGATRVVPIVPALAPLLREALQKRERGVDQVLRLSANNLHRTVHAAIKAAGLEAWPDLFQALRRSCETDLAMHFPQHAVSAWLGHGINVSAKHYLQVPAELYERAAAGKASSALQNALQHGAASGGTERKTA